MIGEEVKLEDIPDPVEPEPPPRLTREQFLNSIPGKDYDHLADARWVYHALSAEDLEPSDAPSPGAWSMLTALQGDDLMLKQFYSTTVPKLFPSKTQQEDNANVDDGRRHFQLIERLLSEPDDAASILTDVEERERKLRVSKKSA